MTPAEKLSKAKRRCKPRASNPQPKKVVLRCRLRESREALRLSIADVAKACGMSVSGLWQIEMGGDPQMTTARKLAKFFGKTTDELWSDL